MDFNKKILSLLFLILLIGSHREIQAAENIFLYKGTLSRTITTKELEIFLKTKKTNQKLKNLLWIMNQDKKSFIKILTYEIDVPINITSKLIYSKIGNVIVGRLADIIYPNKIKNKTISIPAIRSGVI